MSRVRAHYDGSDPDKYLIRSVMRDINGPAGEAINRKSAAVMREMRRTVPVRSGRLLMTIRRESGVGQSGPWFDVKVGERGITNYLGFIIYGTEPHIIRARRRKALRFIGRGGGVVFRRSVRHPGTKKNNFVLRALAKAKSA